MADDLFTKFARDFTKGTVLFREGDVGKEMFVVQSGKVGISKKVREVEKTLAHLGPGEFFGEMAIISNKPRTATATIVEDSRCLVIDHRTFEAMIRGNAEIAVRMIKTLADRLNEADAQIENLMLRDPTSRVVHYLAHSAEVRGKAIPNAVLVYLDPRELHTILGLREEQLNEVLERLGKAKLAVVTEDGIQVRPVPRLREYLEFLEMKEKFNE